MGGMFAFLDNVFIGSSSAFPYKIHMTGSFLTLSKALPKQLRNCVFHWPCFVNI